MWIRHLDELMSNHPVLFTLTGLGVCSILIVILMTIDSMYVNKCNTKIKLLAIEAQKSAGNK